MNDAMGEVPFPVRHAMTAAGLPFPLVWSSAKGPYLAAWLIARKDGRPLKVMEAAAAAGVTYAAVEHWRRRDREFKAAERWARFEEPYRAPDPEPDPAGMQTAEATMTFPSDDELRDKFARTRAILDSIGPPPFRGTRFEVERLEGSYDQARQHLVELNAEMRRRGLDALPVPRPRRPPPTVRFTRRIHDDTSSWAR